MKAAELQKLQEEARKRLELERPELNPRKYSIVITNLTVSGVFGRSSGSINVKVLFKFGVPRKERRVVRG